jgi:hypothetical protein
MIGELVRVGGTRFVIVDAITNARVVCVFQDGQLSKAIAALGGRVEAEGMVAFKSEGVPVSIYVDDFESIPPDDQLPTLDDLKGINLTDGVGADEFMRRLRE